ncbi:MAG: hypothetical protein EP333_00850 [Bacteroidetes bacterium]|nr:MAG: hypothetical protein EP333_00850 [Bacteroidota bacterium]
MRLLLLSIILLLYSGCSHLHEPILICEELIVSSIELKMVETVETDSPNYILYGTAWDRSVAEPAFAVRIKFLRKDGFVTGVITDLDGNFKIELSPGVYGMEVSYPGYNQYTSELTALDGMKEKIQILIGED